MRSFLLALISGCSAQLLFSAGAQTLAETERLALQNYPGLEQARLEIQLAKEDLFSARASRKVNVTAGVTAALQSIGTNRAFGADLGETALAQAQIEATLPLYTSGAISASIDQTKLLVEASEQAYLARRESVVLQAIIAHLDVVEAREAVLIRQQNSDRLKRQFQAANDRFEVGVLTRTDVALADARYQAALAGLALAESDFEAAIAAYKEITGATPEALAEPSSEQLPELPNDLDEAFIEAQAENPSLKQLRLLTEVSDLAVQAARSGRGVQVEAFGSASLQEGRWDNRFQDSSATVGVRASKLLYDAGRNLSSERKAIAESEQARLQLRLTENELIRNLSSAWAQRLAAMRALEAAEKEVEAARIALEGAEVEVSVGLRTTLDMLDQEQNLLDAQLRLIGARKNVYIAHSQIRALLGVLSSAAG